MANANELKTARELLNLSAERVQEAELAGDKKRAREARRLREKVRRNLERLLAVAAALVALVGCGGAVERVGDDGSAGMCVVKVDHDLGELSQGCDAPPPETHMVCEHMSTCCGIQQTCCRWELTVKLADTCSGMP